MSREAMKLALEALEDANDVARMEFSDEDYYGEAITALRQALETEQEPGTWRQARSLTDELMDCVDRLGSEADTVDPRVWQHLLVYAPKHEKEPVAWANSFDLQNFDMKVRTCPDLHHTVPLYTAPPKRELTCVCGAVWEGETMVHSPRERQWVSLTDEEVWDAIDDVLEGGGWLDVARVLEQAFKEKNT